MSGHILLQLRMTTHCKAAYAMNNARSLHVASCIQVPYAEVLQHFKCLFARDSARGHALCIAPVPELRVTFVAFTRTLCSLICQSAAPMKRMPTLPVWHRCGHWYSKPTSKYSLLQNRCCTYGEYVTPPAGT
jgi:hypothetical protein